LSGTQCLPYVLKYAQEGREQASSGTPGSQQALDELRSPVKM